MIGALKLLLKYSGAFSVVFRPSNSCEGFRFNRRSFSLWSLVFYISSCGSANAISCLLVAGSGVQLLLKRNISAEKVMQMVLQGR